VYELVLFDGKFLMIVGLCVFVCECELKKMGRKKGEQAKQNPRYI